MYTIFVCMYEIINSWRYICGAAFVWQYQTILFGENGWNIVNHSSSLWKPISCRYVHVHDYNTSQLCFLTESQNLTVVPINSGAMKFSWFTTASEDICVYYIVCTPDWYLGNYPKDLTHFTSTTSVVLSGFEEEKGYTCTLSTIDTGGKIYDEIIHTYMKSFGKIK